MPPLHPEVRVAEMVSMGVGNKAFRDIASSEEAIHDRTINYVLKCRGSGQAVGVGVRTSLSPGLCSPRGLGPGELSPTQPDPLSCRSSHPGLHCCGPVGL